VTSRRRIDNNANYTTNRGENMNRPAIFGEAATTPLPCAVNLRLGDYVICPTDLHCTARLEGALADPGYSGVLASYATTAPHEMMGWLYSAARHNQPMLIKLALETPHVLNRLIDTGGSPDQSRANAIAIMRDLIWSNPKLWAALTTNPAFVQTLVKWDVWELAPSDSRQPAEDRGYHLL
jgi:hypothetical protein